MSSRMVWREQHEQTQIARLSPYDICITSFYYILNYYKYTLYT